MSGSYLPRSSRHPFHERLNGVLESAGFDEFVESACAEFHAERLDRPSLPPGVYFRLLFLGCSRVWGRSAGSRGVLGTAVKSSTAVRLPTLAKFARTPTSCVPPLVFMIC